MPKSLIHQILITTGDCLQTEIIYCGDCQRVLPQAIPDHSVDLIYVDPPFFSNQDYEVLWGDGYELRAFEDRWKGGVENYIAWMEPKLRECHRTLKPTGSMYLHCDWHAGSYLRVLMDRIFGDRLVNELIWKRTSGHSGEGEVKKYGAVHDTILFYTKGTKYTFNRLYQSYDQNYVDGFYKLKDPDGRRYMIDNLTGAGVRHGETGKPWKGINPTKKGRHWARPPSELDKWDKEGLIVWPQKKGGMPRYKRYLDEMPGMLLQDIWTDIPPIHAHAKERLDYPTQKPEALLERIVKTSSNVGDVVLDPMCGCGTSIAVAHRLDRKWVGIDVSPTACKLMADRMRKMGAQSIKIEGLPKTIDEVRGLQPFEFQNWVCQKVFAHVSERKVGDMGIDGWLMDGRPLQVKQSEAVGRNVVDNFETAIKRMKKNRGIIVAFSFGKGAYEEVARVKNADGVEIELKTVEDIMREV